jgi:hypothetical protein
MSDEEFIEHAYLARAANSNHTIAMKVRMHEDDEVEFADLYGKE